MIARRLGAAVLRVAIVMLAAAGVAAGVPATADPADPSPAPLVMIEPPSLRPLFDGTRQIMTWSIQVDRAPIHHAVVTTAQHGLVPAVGPAGMRPGPGVSWRMISSHDMRITLPDVMYPGRYSLSFYVRVDRRLTKNVDTSLQLDYAGTNGPVHVRPAYRYSVILNRPSMAVRTDVTRVDMHGSDPASAHFFVVNDVAMPFAADLVLTVSPGFGFARAPSDDHERPLRCVGRPTGLTCHLTAAQASFLNVGMLMASRGGGSGRLSARVDAVSLLSDLHPSDNSVGVALRRL